ncbi:MAG: hypothetical protein D5R97_08165 [Candidatus Syntrophonatronum acetioxidans]|uniref:Aminoglycoside N(3)-acetyltransferase n=1 Tax=Candidatus Syntrophonatronum acetioxidans TaxID=1795816 RepID=A0A424YBN5_9FIRM|nr:MAG: hypothetical protein D5R97_08165 [Candidatus Syntrophonatronum acetioxidans]
MTLSKVIYNLQDNLTTMCINLSTYPEHHWVAREGEGALENYHQKNNAEKYLSSLFEDLNMPQQQIIFLHVSLRTLKNRVDVSYPVLTRAILEVLERLYTPKTILVPTFTYSFKKSGIFHRTFSRSEVGRFSEEVRKFAPYRTPDPIFSVCDVYNYLPPLERDIDYTAAFEENSLFQFLDEEDCLIINLGLDKFISTQLHYIERQNNVDYRYNETFEGVVYYDEKNWEKVNYLYYFRDPEIFPIWNRKVIKECLLERNALKSSQKDNIEVSWISAKAKAKAITEVLSRDEYYLIRWGGG